MISAKELRRLQEEFVKKDSISSRFETASDKYRQRIIDQAQCAITDVQNNKHNYNYTMLDYIPLIQEIDGFSYSQMLYGLWNRTTQKFDVFNPFEKASKELERFGYKLENVSDFTKSKRLYIKISW
jgi:hypothetical protein